MTVAFPLPEWPARLREAGPPEDPSILLRGEAAIGGTTFNLTAIRVDPVRFGPDFRPDRTPKVYAAYELSALLDSLSELTEISEASSVRLGTGTYLMWMLPGSPTAAAG